MIATDLGSESSPQMLARCADFLVQHKQFDKVVLFFIYIIFSIYVN
jgi:hypothetical protein